MPASGSAARTLEPLLARVAGGDESALRKLYDRTSRRRRRRAARGDAVLHLPRGGAWFVGAEHMLVAEGGVASDGLSAADPARRREALPPADYESFRASLTFEVAGLLGLSAPRRRGSCPPARGSA